MPTIDAQVELVAGGKPLEALVQHVEVTDDAGAALAERVRDLDGVDELAAAPYVLVGTADEIVASGAGGRASGGGSPASPCAGPAMDAVAAVLRRCGTVQEDPLDLAR